MADVFSITLALCKQPWIFPDGRIFQLSHDELAMRDEGFLWLRYGFRQGHLRLKSAIIIFYFLRRFHFHWNSIKIHVFKSSQAFHYLYRFCEYSPTILRLTYFHISIGFVQWITNRALLHSVLGVSGHVGIRGDEAVDEAAKEERKFVKLNFLWRFKNKSKKSHKEQMANIMGHPT